MNKHFVSVKIDAEKGEGEGLAERFGVRGFPTLLIVGPNGEELDRLVGYRPPGVLLAELDPIRRGESFGALKERVATDANDFEAKVLLARKHRERNELEDARALLDSVVAGDGVPAEIQDGAAGGLAMVTFLQSGGEDVEGVRAYFRKHRDSARATEQATALYMYYGEAEETEKFVPIAEYILRHERGRDPQFLNNYARYLVLHDTRLDRALEIATRAQSMAPVDPDVIDTVAECHARRGDLEKAIELELLAVKYASESARTRFERRVEEFRQQKTPDDGAGGDGAGEESAEDR